MLALFLFGLNLFVLAVGFARTDRKLTGVAPDPASLREPDAGWPPVTLQLPLFNEALVASRLIDVCAALDYPRDLLEIQVLDDSTDETSRIVAERVAHWRKQGVDIMHVHRTDRSGFKAGALQNGLNIARGELIAIFDADFTPKRDFLRRMIPSFSDQKIGLVQARWTHQNADRSLLTRLQAFGLDAHFAVEQRVRNVLGYFMNFNGTAGIWRRQCIEDAGGWQADTLTEDLDLSYRAQLRGWKFVYRPDVTAPAELPEDMNAFRAQQFRWTKGAAQTARKMLPQLWRSGERLAVKLEGTFHLTAHMAYPFVILIVLLHVPLMWIKHQGNGPGEVYFAALGIGLLGFAGFALSQLFAQRELYPDWPIRMRLFPVFMAASMAMSISNGRGIVEALIGRKSAFVRTPKNNVSASGAVSARYRDATVPIIAWIELAIAVYSVGGLVVAIALREWAALPFQLLFVVGFALVSVFSIRQITL